MTQRGKRTYDAARAKNIILDAAEQIFAEQGFSAARIDAIASAAGYNKSLIYQYFQDKLGLYTAVIKRADELGHSIFDSSVGDLLSDSDVASNPLKFRKLLEEMIKVSFRFLSDHPHYVKIFAWEAAEEWKTWKQISYSPDDFFRFYVLAQEAKKNGIVRQDIDARMIPILMTNIVIPFVQSLKRLHPLLAEGKWSVEQETFVEQIVLLVHYGVMEPSLL